MDNLKDLFKDKDKLIDALNSKFEANIDASQKKLFKAFSEGLIDKLQLDENKQVINNQYNRNLLLSADKLFAEYTKQNSPAIIKELLNGVSSIMDFNNKFYSNFTEKAKLLPIKESVLNSLKGWLGIEDNAIKSNGYLDTLVKSDSVKNQIKNTVLKTVYGQEGWDSTKKSLAKMIEGDKENLGVLQKYHRNFAYDLYSQIDRATGKAYADDLGFDFAIYEGGLIETSREFCKEHNGNVYHKSEIADFDPKVAKQPDYNPFTDLGGYGCRHHLNWVPTALALVMRPEAKKFLEDYNFEDTQKIDTKTIQKATEEDYKIAAEDSRYEAVGKVLEKSVEERTISAYTSRGHQVNYGIREGNLTKQDKAFIRNLDKALEQEADFIGVVFRGQKLSKQEFDNYKENVGGEVKFETYISTSQSKERADRFTKDYTFIIQSKTGKNIMEKSNIKVEQEVLFRRNTVFKIEKIEDNIIYLHEK